MAALPLFWLSLSFILGILLGACFSLNAMIWSGLALVFLIFAVLEQRISFLAPLRAYCRRFCPIPWAVVLAVLLVGAARYQSVQPELSPASLAWYSGQDVRVTALVTGYPEPASRSVTLRLETSQLVMDEQMPIRLQEPLLAILPLGETWRYGDILLLEGRLTLPTSSGDFSYSDYLARQGIQTEMRFPRADLLDRGHGSRVKLAIFSLRDLAYRTINRDFPRPESALLSGILLGLDRDLPQGLVNAFRDTGTSHIIAISGFNIAILAALFSLLAGRLFPNRWLALGVSILGITFYTLLVGAQASVVRAAIMGGLGLLGQQFGRRRYGFNILAFTAAMMSLINPFVLWDISFQLSFAATLGLVLYADRLQGWFIHLAEPRLGAFARRLAGPIGEYILFTLAAQVTTLPILVYHFHRLSLISLLANPLILPPQPLVMILGGIVTLVGMVFPPLGRLLALLVWPLLAYTTRLAEWLSSFPGTFSLGVTPLVGVVFFYLLLFTLTYKPAVFAPRRWLRVETALVALVLITALVWRNALSVPDGHLHLSFLNVAGSPVLFVRAPGGQTVLVNGGPDPDLLSAALDRRLSPMDNNLDAFVLTSSASKGMQGLEETLQRTPPKIALLNDAVLKVQTGLDLLENLDEKAMKFADLQTGQTLHLGRDTSVQILVSSENGSALLIERAGFRCLIPGGVPLAMIESLSAINPQGMTILVLDDVDLENQPPEGWLALLPQGVLWVGQGLAPQPEWTALALYEWVEVKTGGDGFTLRAGR